MLRFAAPGGFMALDSIRTRRALVVCAAAFLFTVATPAFKPVTLRASGALYTVTDLGALNCCYDWVYASAALAINAQGNVAGFTSSPNDPSRTIPFVYQNGTMTAITDNYGWATSINDAGEVTGFVLLPGQPNVHAFRYRNGVFTDVGGPCTSARSRVADRPGVRAEAGGPCVHEAARPTSHSPQSTRDTAAAPATRVQTPVAYRPSERVSRALSAHRPSAHS